MSGEIGPPRWLWTGMLLVLILALVAGLVLSVAIAAGWNTPRPPRMPQRRASGPFLLRVAPPDRDAVRLMGWPAVAFTAEVVAQPVGGSQFNGYGLAFRAQGPDRYAVFGVGADGYLAALRVNEGVETPLLEWQQFPHVHRGRLSNRLRVSCAGGVCHFWVNDEYVASLPDDMGPAGDVGLWVRRFEGGEVAAEFVQVTLWQGDP